METIAVPRPSKRVSVRCTECGDTEQINDRSYRRKMKDGKPHVCRLCRQVRQIQPTEEFRDWWKAQLSQQEIDSITSAMF